MSFGELAERSRRLAAGLRDVASVKKGDRVAVMLPKVPELWITAVALSRLGATYLPLFTAFGPSAAAMRVEAAGSAVLITSHQHRDTFEALRDGRTLITVAPPGDEAVAGDVCFRSCEQGRELRPEEHSGHAEPSDLVSLLFTSGTTGQPKGVPVPLAAMPSFEVYMREGLGLKDDSAYWNVADAGWAYGLYYNVYGPLLLGIATHFLGGPFKPRIFLDFVLAHGITNLAAAPSHYRALRAFDFKERPSDFRIECASSAGEPLTPAVSAWFRERFGVPILNHYGQTEVGMICLNHHAGVRARPDFDEETLALSMGLAMHGFDPTVVNDAGEEVEAGQTGQFALRPASSPLFWFGGYWGRDASIFDAKGNYLTGDRAYWEMVRGDRTFFQGGRQDDVITSRGYRVGPGEIEDSIMQLGEFVKEVGVIGVADEAQGSDSDAIKACVVLKTPLGDGDHEERRLADLIREHVRCNLARHLVPRHVEFLEALPKTESGKTKRNLLREWHAAAAKP